MMFEPTETIFVLFVYCFIPLYEKISLSTMSSLDGLEEINLPPGRERELIPRHRKLTMLLGKQETPLKTKQNYKRQQKKLDVPISNYNFSRELESGMAPSSEEMEVWLRPCLWPGWHRPLCSSCCK